MNDNELLYLIRDGNAIAYRVLYDKYLHLIGKMYRENERIHHFIYSDYQQECLMCLETAIHSYRENYNSTFFSYFVLLVRRRTIKLLRGNQLQLREQNMEYQDFMRYTSSNENSLIKSIVHQLDLHEPLDYDLFYECLIQNKPITKIAGKYNLSYQMVYAKYKKIKEKIEKILTNGSN
ncbi:hypothetical protein HDR67_03300 [bacterium]|nr:hypothetical protein [bacterium]